MGAAMKTYDAEEVERGLRVMAECRGNRRLAQKKLEDMGHPVPAETLRSWATSTYAEKYAYVLAEVKDRVHETIATEYETLALQSIELQGELLTDLMTKKDELTPKELATALNATVVAGGVATDKSSALRGRPTAIIENRNPYELLSRWMPALKQYVEGSAEEIPAVEPGMDGSPEGAVVVATSPRSPSQPPPE